MRDKERVFIMIMIKGSTSKEFAAILNVYILSNRMSKYKRHN